MDFMRIYSKLNLRTPLKVDCGRLCSSACCIGDDVERNGMYLVFGEEEYLKDKGFTIEDSEFTVAGKNVRILFCNGSCNRKHRPLACRIFPLFPYIDVKGNMKIIADPRSRHICPLYHVDLWELSSSFIRGVWHVANLLAQEPLNSAMLFELSRLIDETVTEKIRL